MNLLPNSTLSKSYLHKEIYEKIKQDIISGKLREQTRLASIRKHAEFLAVSTTPVEMAYRQLIAEGFIESRPRSGFFVVKLSDMYRNLDMTQVVQGPDSSLPTLQAQKPEYIYDFHMSKIDFTYFPVQEWKRLLNQVFNPESVDILFYGDPQGEPGLRKEITNYLYQFRGVNCKTDNIVIGAEQHLLIHILGQILKDHSDCLAVENPAYPLVYNTFQTTGYQIYPMPMDAGGLDPTALKASHARIVSISPSHQFPVGTVMPVSRRLELLEWAKEVDGFIIEDDYGGEFRYQDKPVPSLQGLLPNDNVIYLGGFSQVLAPDICIHYMVLPDKLVPLYHQYRRKVMMEGSSSRIHQNTLELFMKNGSFERHIRRMRNVYRKKNRELLTAIQQHFNNKAIVIGASAGLHVILQIHSHWSEEDLTAIARKEGIRVSPATGFYLDETPGQKQFIVGFGGIKLNCINEGIGLLHHIWTPMLQ
ncbi:PLP-dependent aminotransferase family protein [Paenibacillus anaericanus]|uniref:PLP-dependent aminotransferase family protein n=1 Tax=Paenibacillus anaericanus TaxID=170367 RepID=A0A3S1C1Z9_9BACL|nr:PLP-dependent aminotransferase family protein [Paenibacillus anaericanus]RUT40493.1 PLP-dependent aminotransferase family protein [Paenibacillus anaericanus]